MAQSARGGFRLLMGATVLAMGWAAPAVAQDSATQAAGNPPASAGQSDADAAVEAGEIVVTATRQAQLLSDVPISVAAFSTKRMDEQAVRQIDDIARLTPGLSFSRSTYGNGSGSTISIRGISSTVGAATTGIYINDTPIQVRALGFTAVNSYPQVFDLERVEVVRGPQGTLFGAGAEGGAVRFITPSPNLSRTEGYGRTELSFTEHGAPSYEGGMALGGPIVTDKIAFRASGWYRRDGGYVDRTDYGGNVVDKNSNSQSSLVLRGALTFAPSEQLKITPSIFYQRVRINDSSAIWENLSQADGAYKNASVIAQPSTDNFILPALNVEYSGDKVSLISVSSYYDRTSRAVFDYTAFTNGTFARNSVPFIPGYLATSQMDNFQKNFVQEVRLQSNDADARLKWVVGGFYSHSRQRGFQNTVDPFLETLLGILTGGVPIELVTGSPVLPGNVVYLNVNRGVDTQLAGFAQVDWRITDRLTATAGVRASRTKFSFTTEQGGPGAGTAFFTASGTQKETPVTPKFGLSYEPSDDLLVYASAAKGFRIGGVNSPVNPVQCAANLAALGRTQAPSSYDSDSVWSYEAGVKGSTPGRKLQVEASVFYIDWKNVQQFVYLPLCGLGFVANSGAASSRGFDLTAQLKVTPAITVGGSVGYVDAHYDDTVATGVGPNIVTKGDKIGGSPWVVNLSLRGDVTTFGLPAYARLDYDFRDRAAFGIPARNAANLSYDPFETPADAQNNVSARVGANFSGFDLSLFVTNLLDKKPSLARSHFGLADPVFTTITLRPRTFGLTGVYRY